MPWQGVNVSGGHLSITKKVGQCLDPGPFLGANIRRGSSAGGLMQRPGPRSCPMASVDPAAVWHTDRQSADRGAVARYHQGQRG